MSRKRVVGFYTDERGKVRPITEYFEEPYVERPKELCSHDTTPKHVLRRRLEEYRKRKFGEEVQPKPLFHYAREEGQASIEESLKEKEKKERERLLEKALKRTEEYHKPLNPEHERKLLLHCIEEGQYDLSKIRRYVEDQMIEHEKSIEELENMSEEEFMNMVSKYIYGVASKEYYITMHKKAINSYKHALDRIKSIIKLRKENPQLYDYVIRRDFEGQVREARRVFDKLYQESMNKKLTQAN
ncbi:MAG: hypothetical protein QXS29_06010 [Nitrososphaeria archaeon]